MAECIEGLTVSFVQYICLLLNLLYNFIIIFQVDDNGTQRPATIDDIIKVVEELSRIH